MRESADRPNIVIMYADDLGFGDVGCYGGTGIPTPNIDRLAAQGLKFIDGYASAATCTPSRYSLLTGSYPWRNERAAILAGDAPIIIPPGSPTLPSIQCRSEQIGQCGAGGSARPAARTVSQILFTCLMSEPGSVMACAIRDRPGGWLRPCSMFGSDPWTIALVVSVV